ncbi:MAG TPA: hypothetical protein VN228_21950 [Pyrinomonadaceae bacterium]|nr:hypothetical protein [Pyrinomonadaceae bacterium]
MSSEQDRVRELAERVARRLAGGPAAGGAREEAQGGELSALRASLSEIQRRLAHIESHLTHEEDCDHAAPPDETAPARRRAEESPPPAATPARSMWLSGTYVPATAHPSQERFTDIGEAVSELVDFFEREKSCTVEPGGKPCDHCGMCNSRGF